MAVTVVTAEEFIEKLQQYSSPQVFNPWADYDTECDIGPVSYTHLTLPTNSRV